MGAADHRALRWGGKRMSEFDGDELPEDWAAALGEEFEKQYWRDLRDFVLGERKSYDVYPPAQDVFAAFRLTHLADAKVVILGQDPYPGAGQAHGLAFSVPCGVPVPGSLKNIHRELHDDLCVLLPEHGNLEPWARQGVLLLNTVLTVRASSSGSHSDCGWETFTDEVIKIVDAKAEPVVFILWGKVAQRKRTLITRTPPERIIESAHPSPRSARKGFFQSRPFSRANCALVLAEREGIDWRLSDGCR